MSWKTFRVSVIYYAATADYRYVSHSGILARTASLAIDRVRRLSYDFYGSPLAEESAFYEAWADLEDEKI